jgi:putative transposase
MVINAINGVLDRHPRDGFWLISNRLKKQGFKANHKRIYRVYKALGLNIQRRSKKRIPERVKEPLQDIDKPDEQWSMDFMSDTLYNGRRYRILNVMDEFNRELIEFEIGSSLPSSKVIQTLQRAVDMRGKPESIRVDNGPEFISRRLEIWCYIKGIKLKFIQPGCPTQNSRVERFNGTMRREFFNAYIFDTLAEVKLMAREWVDDYNNHRPHKFLGKLSPIEYLNKYNQKKNYSV